MYNVVTALCLIALVSIIASTVLRLCLSSRADRLKYLKNFKKGKFALIYIAALPLYYIGYLYGGTAPGFAILDSVKSCIELVVLKYGYSGVYALMTDNLFYRVTMDICFALVAVNAAIFTATLLWQNIYNYFRAFYSARFAKRVIVVFGSDKGSRDIAASASNAAVIIVCAEPGGDIKDFAYIIGAACVRASKGGAQGVLEKHFKKTGDRELDIIVNTGDDKTNLIYTEQLATFIGSAEGIRYSIDDRRGINVYVFGEPENAGAFLHFAESSNGLVHYVNKYKLIATDFIDKYPITQYMGAEHIDFEHASIKDDLDVGIVMIGFGKTNRQIFLTSVANNRLIGFKDGEVVSKPVQYYIYDRKGARNDKNLNHDYYRYLYDYDPDGEYLPLPEKPAEERFFVLDINDPEFYRSVKENLSPVRGRRKYSYIVIAFGTDMENLDLADKISSKIKEWGLSDSVKVFVKIRSAELAEKVIDSEYAGDAGFVTFGKEARCVYNIDSIMHEKHELMALARHLAYALAADNDSESEEAAKEKALSAWFDQSRVQRESNIYACLAIRMKLNLMGYDHAPASDPAPDASAAFYSAYTAGDPIIYDETKPAVKGRRIVKYTNDFIENSTRGILAKHEHLRWNAYMLTSGFVPQTLDEIRAGKTKDMTLRRHGNLTTYEGLKEYRRIVAEERGCSEEETDVIRYDYQLMDDVKWILATGGYKIIEKAM